MVQAATNIPDGTVISTDTTWDNSGDATFILEGSVTVNPGVTLTIEEGVQVLADVEDAVINVEGTLDAQGSSANPITMDIDPNAGIDSWIGLRFATTDATAPVGSMTFVEILNTGAPDTDDFSAAIAADNASTIAITNSTIMTVTRTTAGNSYGVFADQSSTITLDTVTIEAVLGNTTTPDPDDDGRGIAGQSTSTFNLTDVTIEDTNYPIYEEDGSTTDDTLTFAIDNVDIISATVLGHFMPDTLAMFFNDLGSDDDFGCTPTTTDSCFEQISDASVEIREGILSMDTRWISTDDLTDYYLLDPDGSSPSNAVVAVSPDTTLTISPTTAMTISVADSRALHIGQPESIQSNTGIGAEDSRLIIDNPNAFDLVMTSISGRWAGIFFGPRASGDLEYLTILNTGKRNIAPISPGDGGTRAAIAVYQATVDIRSTLILTPTTGGDSVPSDADGAIGLYVNDGIVTLSDDSRIQDVNGEDPPIEDNGILAEGDSAYVTVIDTVITASQDSNILARDGATVKLINSESSQSEEAHGLLLRNGSTAIINCSAILSNTNGSTGSGILIANLSSLQEDPTLVVRGSQISGNDFGLAVDETTVSTAATVDVIENWWGAADGPGAPDGPGSGDPLSDDAGIADFDPFATDIADLVCSSDITFIKTAALDEVDAGGTLTYTLTVDNPTPIDSDSVTISDTVPVSTTLVSFAPDPASCTFADNVLSCDIGSVPAESTEAITMVVQVDSTADSTAPGTIDNTGEAIISNDLTPADNIDSVSTAIIQRADLEVAKEVSSPIIQGNSITYTLTITNNGPALASGVILTDTLPVSVTYDSDTGGCTEDSGEVTCAIGSLDVNISTTLDILVVVDTDVAVGDTFTNTVEVSGSTTDPDTTNNTAETPATVGTGADMEVTKSVDPSAEVKAGNTITYTIIATNNGPQSTGGVVFTDTLPVSVTTPITIETSSNVSCSRTDEEVVCSQSTDFDADDTEIVTITVSTDTDLTGTLTNTVEISADEDDPDSSNNSDEVAIEAVIEPELSLSKVTDPITATQNEVLTYTITITNEGPSVARSVIVTDTLPDDVDLQEFSPTSDCSESSSAITCDFGTLDPDDVETVTVIVTPTLAGIITNTAELDSIDTDVISESVETTVQSLADLQSIKR
ncbi:MAG: DUF11 domain-containing protein [Chloroflexaceae bacterium]|nr:DUF11 domain-containing protein [Chloroflexaceae bacterium]